MEILDPTTAGTLVTQVTGVITDNMPGVLVILGFAVGVAVAFGLLRFGLAKLSSSWRG